MTITIKDIAQMANTSTATVSRVLSNKPGVAEDKRNRIIELADRLGYSPNLIAKNLAMKKSHILGFIAADLHNPVYIEFLRRAQARVEKDGYRVLVADSEQDITKEKLNIQVMREHRAEGLLIFPIHDWQVQTDIEHFLELKLQKFPFVLVGKIEGYGFDYVTSEEENTARRMTDKLLDAGHRRIGFVGAHEANRCINERLAGVHAAMAARGLKLDQRDIVHGTENWQEPLRQMLERPDRPTALVMTSDLHALQSIRTIQDVGLTMPDDLSIVAFGDGPWSACLRPAITTTFENVKQVATDAMDLLLRRMDDPTRSSEQRLVAQEIIVRESIAPPRG